MSWDSNWKVKGVHKEILVTVAMVQVAQPNHMYQLIVVYSLFFRCSFQSQNPRVMPQRFFSSNTVFTQNNCQNNCYQTKVCSKHVDWSVRPLVHVWFLWCIYQLLYLDRSSTRLWVNTAIWKLWTAAKQIPNRTVRVGATQHDCEWVQLSRILFWGSLHARRNFHLQVHRKIDSGFQTARVLLVAVVLIWPPFIPISEVSDELEYFAR